MMHDYFNFFLKREGVQAHNARLIVNPASHTVNSSTYKLMCDCMIFYILFALLFNFLKHMRCERMEAPGTPVPNDFHFIADDVD